MTDPVVMVSLVFGALGVLLGAYAFVRREALLRRISPWERHARTVARMGEEYLRNADNSRGGRDEAERTIREMITAGNSLAESMRRAGVELAGEARNGESGRAA
jgi:hypothetical protein